MLITLRALEFEVARWRRPSCVPTCPASPGRGRGATTCDRLWRAPIPPPQCSFRAGGAPPAWAGFLRRSARRHCFVPAQNGFPQQTHRITKIVQRGQGQSLGKLRCWRRMRHLRVIAMRTAHLAATARFRDFRLFLHLAQGNSKYMPPSFFRSRRLDGVQAPRSYGPGTAGGASRFSFFISAVDCWPGHATRTTWRRPRSIRQG